MLFFFLSLILLNLFIYLFLSPGIVYTVLGVSLLKTIKRGALPSRVLRVSRVRVHVFRPPFYLSSKLENTWSLL